MRKQLERRRYFRPIIILWVLSALGVTQLAHSYYETKQELKYYQELTKDLVLKGKAGRPLDLL